MIYKPTYDYGRVLFDDVNSCGKALSREGRILVNIVEGVKLDDSRYVAEGWNDGEFITWISPFNERNRLQDVNLTACAHFRLVRMTFTVALVSWHVSLPPVTACRLGSVHMYRSY